VNSLQGSLFINDEGFDKASEIPVEWEPDAPELFGSPSLDPLDQRFLGGLVVREPLIVRWQQSVSIAQFTWNTELSDRNHVGSYKGVPDRGQHAPGHEPRQIVVFQVDKAVTFAEVNSAHVDTMKQIAGIIGEVAQFLGQMSIGVEGIGDVEDNPRAAFLGCGARTPNSLGRHGATSLSLGDHRIRGG
jgi:hypothetical protein